MTATDELRRLLDGRGVEWTGTSFSTPAKGHPTNTSLGEEHHEATFIEYDDGNVLRLFDLTPAQAVEATLGSDLQAENEKLRELVQDMYACIEALCSMVENSPGCSMCPTNQDEEKPCAAADVYCRMRELGVEV